MDTEKLRKSLVHLEAQITNWEESSERGELTYLDREAIAESVVQRFEVAYDVLWKALRRHMIVELGMVEAPSSPKPLFRMADRNDLLPSPVENWLEYADARVATSHDYSEEKAELVRGLARSFLRDSVKVYGAISGRESLAPDPD